MSAQQQGNVVYSDRVNIGKPGGTAIRLFVEPDDTLHGKKPNGDIVDFFGGTAAVDNKNIVLVDYVFGNDATAIKYDMFKPYQTINAAITASVAGDLIMVNPAPEFSYIITVNMFKPGVSYYFWKGATAFIFTIGDASSGTEDISILGNGDLRFYAYTLLGGTYSGNFTMEADYITYNQASYYGGNFSGNVKIKCNQKMLLGARETFFYWDNIDYYPTATRPNLFTMDVNEVELGAFSTVLILYRDSVQINFNFKKYTYNGNPVAFAKEFFKVSSSPLTYEVVNTIHIDDAVSNKAGTYSDCVFLFSGGSPLSKTIITGNYSYYGSGGAVQLPVLIQAGSNCAERIFFNGVASIKNGSMFADFNSTSDCRVIIDGKVYVDNSLIDFVEYLYSVYFVSGCRLQVKADTIADNPVNSCLTLSSYDINSVDTGEVDIVNCQFVNTSATGIQPAVINKGLSPFLGTALWGEMRIQNVKIVTTGVRSIDGGIIGQIFEIISSYANKPSSLVTNLLAAPLGEVVDSAITSDEF